MASQGTQKMFTNELLEALLYEQYYTINLLLPFFLQLLTIALQFCHYLLVLPNFDGLWWHGFIQVPLLTLYAV